jgi:broad specificity phosphatase PhoE
MKNIWLIRHGESQSNSGEKTTHPGTSILTQRGLLQAECISSYIQCRPDIIIHSPYTRALQSAQATINKFPDVTVDEWPVQEFVYLPDEKYLNSTQADRLAAVNEYWEQCDPEQKASDEAESFIEFIDRIEIMVEKLMRRKDHVIVFTHGHVIRAVIWKIITGALKNNTIGMAQYRSLRQAIYIPNAAILKIRLDEQELQMSQLITRHIKPELFT